MGVKSFTTALAARPLFTCASWPCSWLTGTCTAFTKLCLIPIKHFCLEFGLYGAWTGQPTGSKAGVSLSCTWSAGTCKQGMCSDTTSTICIFSSLFGMYVEYSLVDSVVHKQRYANFLLLHKKIWCVCAWKSSDSDKPSDMLNFQLYRSRFTPN